MKAVRADFVIRRKPPRWLWIALGLLWMLTLALSAWAWMRHAQFEDMKRAQAAALGARSAEKAIPQSEPPPPYLQSAQEMLQERELTALLAEALTALETASMPGVTVASIDMTPSERAIRVVVSVEGSADPVAYLQLLNEGNPSDSTGARWKLNQLRTGSAGEQTMIMSFARGS